MEKILLKPVIKEIVHSSAEPGLLFDIANATGSTHQEKNLGSLLVLSHLKQKDESLNYIVSLVSSLARREFYSPQSISEQAPKAAFERTLKKLNEVLEDFFKKQDFTLNLGLAAISGGQIYLSRLGKFKVALARNHEYIDILNNIGLFSKDEHDESQFSNIVSGRLLAGDKIFAYFPVRSITSREKALNPLFISQNQSEFAAKLAGLSQTADNFACCGVHISMQQIKEIPVTFTGQSAADIEVTPDVALAPAAPSQSDAKRAAEDSANWRIGTGSPNIIRAEVSVGRRANLLNTIAHQATRLRRANWSRPFAALAILAVIIAVGWFWIGGTSSEAKAAYNQALQNFKLAQSKISESDSVGARALLSSAIGQVSTLNDKKSLALASDIGQALDTLNHVSNQFPTLVADADTGKLFVNPIPSALQDKVTGSTAIYEGNLYVLVGTAVYKYADALKGATKQTDWGTLEAPAIAIAIDGNLYALASDGKLAKYFKGKKVGEASLGIIPSANSHIFTGKDSATVYLADSSARRVYVFDKITGELKTTYKLDAAGTVQDIRIADDGTIWLLSLDNQVWNIKP